MKRYSSSPNNKWAWSEIINGKTKERILFMENGCVSSYLFSFAQGPLGTGDMYYTADTIKEQEKKT